MSGRLEGKVAIITGAGQGIGAAIADLYAHFGLTADAIVPQIQSKLNA